MDKERFEKTKWFKQILEDARSGVIDKDLRDFNQEWATFWTPRVDALGKILVAHLAVEHFLERNLIAANPGLSDLAKCRLSFLQKLEMVRTMQGLGAFLYEGMRLLNAIRNRLAHSIDSSLTTNDVAPLRHTLEAFEWYKDRPRGDEVDSVVQFALLACGFLAGEARSITRHGEGKGMLQYREWLQEMMKEEVD